MNSEEALRDLFEKSERENAAVDLEDVLPILGQAKREEWNKAIEKVYNTVYELSKKYKEVSNKEGQAVSLALAFEVWKLHV